MDSKTALLVISKAAMARLASVREEPTSLLIRREGLLRELNRVEEEILARFPEHAPKCRYCGAEFSRGWHSQCCGGC